MRRDKNVCRMVFCGLVFLAAVVLRASVPPRGITVGVFAEELNSRGIEGAITALGRAAAGKASGGDVITALLSGEDETETGKEKDNSDEKESRFSDWRDVPLPAGYSFKELK